MRLFAGSLRVVLRVCAGLALIGLLVAPVARADKFKDKDKDPGKMDPGGKNGRFYAPEIDPGTLGGALIVLAGGILILNDRRRRR